MSTIGLFKRYIGAIKRLVPLAAAIKQWFIYPQLVNICSSSPFFWLFFVAYVNQSQRRSFIRYVYTNVHV